MKIQLFLYNTSGAGPYLLRLKDGIYDRVLWMNNPCTAKGMPIIQQCARALNKTEHTTLITSPHIGHIEFGLPDNAEVYTAKEIADIDKRKM